MGNDPYIGPYWAVVRLQEYDNLSPKERERLAYHPSTILSHHTPENALRMMAKKDYGKDHPQAQGEFLWPLRK